MSTREDLEAALHARPDETTLLVYADLLQAEGDPRGELIALDLRSPAISMHGVETRRGQLLRRWLGDDIVIQWHTDAGLWHVGELETTYATFDCGFVDLVVADDLDGATLAQLLHGPGGDYLRRTSISGSTELLELVLAHLAAKRRPWLQQLAVSCPHVSTPLASKAIENLATATPHLEVLDLRGHYLFHQFTHPNLRELAIDSWRSIDLNDGPPLPALHTIDVAFDREQPFGHLCMPQRVPALRRLGFSRVEHAREQLFEELGTLDVAAQITYIVLPSIRSPRDHALVQAAIDRMPMLREIEIARTYSCHGPVAELRHTWARVKVPVPYPWPPRDLLDRMLMIDGYSTELRELVDVLEEQYRELPDEPRAIWDRFWMIVDNLEGSFGSEQAFNALDLAKALGALALPPDFAALRDHLRARLAQRPQGFFAVLRWV